MLDWKIKDDQLIADGEAVYTLEPCEGGWFAYIDDDYFTRPTLVECIQGCEEHEKSLS